MYVQDTLELVKDAAKKDPAFCQTLIHTEEKPNGIDSFCALCTEKGFPIYPIDLILAGEESYAAMRRSTNGGGENSPLLAGEDDLYSMFLIELKQIAK